MPNSGIPTFGCSRGRKSSSTLGMRIPWPCEDFQDAPGCCVKDGLRQSKTPRIMSTWKTEDVDSRDGVYHAWNIQKVWVCHTQGVGGIKNINMSCI